MRGRKQHSNIIIQWNFHSVFLLEKSSHDHYLCWTRFSTHKYYKLLSKFARKCPSDTVLHICAKNIDRETNTLEKICSICIRSKRNGYFYEILMGQCMRLIKFIVFSFSSLMLFISISHVCFVVDALSYRLFKNLSKYLLQNNRFHCQSTFSRNITICIKGKLQVKISLMS